MNSTSEGRSRLPIETTASAAALVVGKLATRVAAALGDQAQGGSDDDPEGSLATDEEFHQRQPGHILDGLTAQSHQRPVGEDDIQTEDIVGGHAILHAAQATGIGGEIASDRTDFV